MDAIWKVAIGIAGLGAVGSMVVWSLYSQWLRLDIFQRMTKRQQFVIFILFLSFTFLFGIAALVTYAYVNSNGAGSTDGRAKHVSADASVQEFHIIRGATRSPILINSISGDIDELDSYEELLSNELIKSIDPKPAMDVDLAIDGVHLSATKPLDILARGGGVQGYGSYRKIAEITPDGPLDCDRLFAGEYPGGYFKPDTEIALFVRTPNGQFWNSQVIVSKDDHGYSLKTATVEKKARISLEGRPLKILVDKFASAGEPEGRAKEIAATLEAQFREVVRNHELLTLSPHSLDDIYRVHEEVKLLNPDNPGKGPVLALYGVDYIVRCTVKLSPVENDR